VTWGRRFRLRVGTVSRSARTVGQAFPPAGWADRLIRARPPVASELKAIYLSQVIPSGSEDLLFATDQSCHSHSTAV
jgi:hypothetical protein